MIKRKGTEQVDFSERKRDKKSFFNLFKYNNNMQQQ